MSDAGRSAALAELVSTLEALRDHQKFNRLKFFVPYPKQQEFFDMGSSKDERLLSAGNQYGKTEAGAAECTYHLTGLYPADWLGKKFDRPTKGWICGETGLVVRDVQQKKLCGEPGVTDEFGTGYIPKELFVDKPSLARGVTDAYDTIQVRHVSGGISIGRFKSYEQGRAKMQGDTLDWIWDDEEPPEDIYNEQLVRLRARRGIMFITYTPLKGMSSVSARFFMETHPLRGLVRMGIEDALHIPAEERQRIIDQVAPHERDARISGLPFLGSGRIFPYSDDAVKEPLIEDVPLQWAKLWGIDFGIGHPFAAVLIAWDKDNDVIHVLNTIRVADQLPLQHAKPMKMIGRSVPVAWPQDGTAREKSGEQVSSLYRKEGLNMLANHATWPQGGVSTETGVLEMQDRITTGRLKVAAHLSEWFEEFRLYHRKDGMIVKERDDILSATRVAIMMKRYAKPVPLGSGAIKRRRGTIAHGVDFDIFG